MSLHPTSLATALVPSTPEAVDAFRKNAYQILSERFGAKLDPRDQWGLTVEVDAAHLHAALKFLRDDPSFRCDVLLDITAIDYLGYPGHDQARFAVVYLLRSMRSASHRIRVKIWVEEDSPKVPSVHDLWKIADWQERETWDQYGIVFDGHPNLKRLLNHVEFVGHPLRKDYPAKKRQWLSTNDPMIDQLEARLVRNGFDILVHAPVNSPSVEETGLLGKPSRVQNNNVGNAK
jgi:NADH-quinone oxidoreductase subunit C